MSRMDGWFRLPLQNSFLFAFKKSESARVIDTHSKEKKNVQT